MLRRSSGSVRVFYPKLRRAEVIAALRARIPALASRLPLSKVVLFGSYAKGNYTVGSDIDLLVVYTGEKRPDAYALVKRLLDLPRLEPHIYTQEEYQALSAALEKMTREGIVLYEAGEGGPRLSSNA